METVLRHFGNSVGLVIPKPVRESLHLSAGQIVTLEQTQQGLFVRTKAPQYTLEKLLAQCDLEAPHSPDIAQWQDMPAIGKESW
jgi:antitoxin ChpS